MACKDLTWEDIRHNRIPDGARPVSVRDGFSNGNAGVVAFEEDIAPEQQEENRRLFMQDAGEVAAELARRGDSLPKK